MNKTYFVGISKRGKTMVIEARQNKDDLSCELYDYFGERVTTKQALYNNRYNILAMMQAERPKVYKNLKFAVVD